MTDSKTHVVFMAVGSNLGEKRENCRQGIQRFLAVTDSRITGRSGYYRTAPVGFRDQDWFVNAAFRIETKCSPDMLLDGAKSTEQDAGRTPGGIRFGPRALDLDIIFYDDQIVDRPGLKIPHPRMHFRRFVLQSICDIDPAFMHPVLGKTVRTLLLQVDDPAQTVTALQDD